jgi:hypothetical protein
MKKILMIVVLMMAVLSVSFTKDIDKTFNTNKFSNITVRYNDLDANNYVYKYVIDNEYEKASCRYKTRMYTLKADCAASFLNDFRGDDSDLNKIVETVLYYAKHYTSCVAFNDNRTFMIKACRWQDDNRTTMISFWYEVR